MRYQKADFTTWKFTKWKVTESWFHVIISIGLRMGAFWKCPKKLGFHRLFNMFIFSIFEHFEKLLNFERLWKPFFLKNFKSKLWYWRGSRNSPNWGVPELAKFYMYLTHLNFCLIQTKSSSNSEFRRVTRQNRRKNPEKNPLDSLGG